MAHFAALDENNIVTEVIVVDNAILGDPEDERLGIAWLRDFDALHGYSPAQWVQTSYNGNFRGRYAGVGMIYDTTLDEFIAPEPEPVPEPIPLDENPILP
jgi:hypothetical protein